MCTNDEWSKSGVFFVVKKLSIIGATSVLSHQSHKRPHNCEYEAGSNNYQARLQEAPALFISSMSREDQHKNFRGKVNHNSERALLE